VCCAPRREPRPWLVPALLIAAAVACLVALVLSTRLARTVPRSHAVTLRGRPHSQATRLPVGLAPIVSASVGASERSFWPVRRGASLLTRGGGIHSTFTTSGAVMGVAHGTLDLSLATLERGQRLTPVVPVKPQTAGSRVLYRHGSISEFYRNGPYGLEQGFSLQRRPRAGAGPLVLVLGLGGSLLPTQVGSQILFRTYTGATALRYGQLSVVDATGRRLPAHMQVRNGSLQLGIDDSHAHYPVRIDPLIQQGEKLVRSSESGEGIFDAGVTLSPAGNAALIGSGKLTALSPATVETANNGPVDVAVSPDGKSVYVGYEFGTTVSWYERNTANGDLTLKDTVTAGTGPRTIVVSSDGKSVYVGNFEDGTVSQFDRNTETGELTALRPATVATGSDPHGVAVSPDGESVYVANYGGKTISEFSRNIETGKLTALSSATVPTETNPNGVTVSPDGAFAYVANRGSNTISQYSRDTQTGQLVALSPVAVATGKAPYNVVISPNGISAYAGNRESNTISQYLRNTKTGQLTALTPAAVATGSSPHTVAVSPDGASVYVSDNGSNAVSQFSRNTDTGELTALSPATVAAGTSPYGIAVSPDGRSAYVANEQSNSVSQYSREFIEPKAPTVVTEAASSVTQSAATVHASVNPNGGEVSECRFEYGTSTSYGSSLPCSSLPGSGESPVAVSAPLGGLSANTTYHFRVVATNSGGTSQGSDESFATLANAPSGSSGGGSSGDASSGGGSAGSVGTGSITSAQIAALLAGQLTPSGKATKIPALLKSGGLAVVFNVPEAGAVVIGWYQLPLGAKLTKHANPNPVLVAAGRRTFVAAGTATITIKLTAAGKRLLKHAKKLKLTAKGSFTPTGKAPITTTKAFVLKH
jgi:DNA-binding beta-propeller fold protein YncE